MSKENIPRYVITIVDTKTTVDKGKGSEYLTVSAAATKLSDFTKPYTSADKANAPANCDNELESMFAFFKADIKEAKERTEVDSEVNEMVKVKKK